MTARSMWNGTLKVGKLGVSVKMYAAVEDAAVHFHLLHESDNARLEQRMVNPETGDVCESKDIRRAFEVKRGSLVLITDAELAKLDPAPSRDIEIERFVPAASIEPVWYQRPYFLSPAGKSQDYFALAHVLASDELVGLARWVMRKRLYHGALRAHGQHLILASLHSRDEVVQPPKVKAPARAADARELGMAEQLVAALAGEFDPSQFRDEHRARVRELIAAKAKGKSIELPRRARRRAARDLGSALEQSLKQVQRQAKAEERRSA